MYIGHQYIFCHLNTNRQFCNFSSALSPAYALLGVPEYQVGWQTMNVMCDVSHIPYHILHVMLELVVYMSN